MPAHDGGRKQAIAAYPADGEERECFVSCGFVGTASPSESGAEDAANMVQVEEEAAESERRRFCVIGIVVVGADGGGVIWRQRRRWGKLGWLVKGARPIIHKSFFLACLACQRIGAEPYSIIASFRALAYLSKIQNSGRPSVLPSSPVLVQLLAIIVRNGKEKRQC